jgi:hypothetical protein
VQEDIQIYIDILTGRHKYRWMDGRMDGWMGGRMDGWMDGYMDRPTDREMKLDRSTDKKLKLSL